MFDITLLPTEILLEILGNLPLKSLIQSEEICKLFKEIIRENTFEHIMVRVKKIHIPQVSMTHSFVSYNLRYTNVTDNDIILLIDNLFKKNKHIQKLDLTCNKYITNKSLEKMSFCTDLDLSFCNKITDKALRYLTNCIHLNLDGCHRITDKGLKFLSKCQNICLNSCDKITDCGLKELSSCKELVIQYNSNINGSSFAYLTKCKFFSLIGCCNLTHDNIKKLSKINDAIYIDLSNNNITDDILINLSNFKNIMLYTPSQTEEESFPNITLECINILIEKGVNICF